MVWGLSALLMVMVALLVDFLLTLYGVLIQHGGVLTWDWQSVYQILEFKAE